MRTRGWLVGGVVLVGLGLSCVPLPTERRTPSAPSGPPLGRGQSCLHDGARCDTGLTCVEFDSTIGHQATCDIPCGDGCPDGMTCGTRHDIVFGDAARNVCL